MAKLPMSFDAADLPQSESNFDPLPAGWYSASIHSAEWRQNKAGTGAYIKVRYDITGPTHSGRVVFGNLNVQNASPEAERIGKSQLRILLDSVGLPRLTDTDQLVGRDVRVKLSVRKDEQYGDSNDIKAWEPAGGKGSQPMPSAAVGTTKSAPPWAKKG